MAITRSQQAKQLLQDGGMLVKPSTNGKRPGYRSAKTQEVQGRTTKSKGISPGQAAAMFGTDKAGTYAGMDKDDAEATIRSEVARQRNKAKLDTFKEKRPPVKFRLGPFDALTGGKFAQGFANFLASKNRPFFEKVIRAGRFELPGELGEKYGKLDFSDLNTMTEEELEQAYKAYDRARLGGEIRAIGDKKPGFGKDQGDYSISQLPLEGILAAKPTDEEVAEYVNPLSLLTPRIAGSQFVADGGRIGAMDGGIINVENLDREAFLLGGIAKGLKKAVRGVKKLAKSPLGKAALIGAGFGLAGMGPFKGLAGTSFGKGLAGLRGTLFGQAGSRVGEAFVPYKEGLFTKLGLTKGGGSFMPTIKGGITLASILPLLVGKTDEEKDDILKEYYASQKLTPSTTARQAGSEFDFYNYNLAEGGRIGYSSGSDKKFKKKKLPIEIPVSPLDERINELYEKLNLKEGLKGLEKTLNKRKLNAEGGSQKEPVAKKVMPLLDMGGMEKDYRAEGGFVPIGRMEKADDVPARLSKNEFVFTADAVRNAGDGDVDKGAEVMYNMMKNLEAGGEVSEESQGLDGAREMFQTSQRLGEVI